MRVLELGSLIAPAYCGLILAEQGCEVTKWYRSDDPVFELVDGDKLWDWINHGKTLEERSLDDLRGLLAYDFDMIVDNVRPDVWKRRGIEPMILARHLGVAWVSIRADVGDTSFDVIAQARSWMEYGPWMPFYLGDTCAGLWAAFKLLAMTYTGCGHAVIGHASCLQKLVEGELVLDPPRDGHTIPWDVETYTGEGGVARVEYRGREYREPARDRAWKLKHLRHVDGRIVI